MPRIFNQFGDVITRRDKMAMGLYPSPYSFNNYGNFRIRPNYLQDTEKSVSATDRRSIVSLSRQLFAQMPALAASSRLKASLAVGNCYDLIYTGDDKEFGKFVMDWVPDWYTKCCVGGIAFNFKKCLKLWSKKLDEDGDNLFTFVPSRSGLPLLQFVPSHRIDQRNFNKTIRWGKNEYRVEQGVVKNSFGYPVGYYIQNEDEEEDYIASSRDAFLVYDPDHFDLGRGLPVIASGLTTGLSLLDIQEALQTTIKLESMVNMVESNESGEAPAHRTFKNTAQVDDEDLPMPNVSVAPPQIEPIQEGLRYIKSGNKLESFKSNRPATETQEYLTQLQIELVSLTGIPHQVIFSPHTVGGKAAFGLSEIVRETVFERQQILDFYATLAVSKAIAIAITNGDLPETQEKYWRYLSFSHPEEFTLDRGYDSDIELNEKKAGITTLEDIAQKRGKRKDEIRFKRKQDAIDLYSDIAEIKKQFPQYSETQIHNDLSMLSANPLPEKAAPKEEK